MNDAPDYRVSLGKIARTIVYYDALGAISFVFDASALEDESKDKWKLYLDRRPMVDNKTYEPRTESERQRIAFAIERTKEYAESKGYLVEVS
jgi:hypothetical protein